ncbi:MAG: primosomal protein N', partial [Alphaproteobacteria bacterium]|nr:primosomal protein N' [Alphaproteobacteria bacterium]
MTDGPAHSARGDTAVAEVLVPVAVDQTYSYCVPRGLSLEPGDFVEVPLGPRLTEGVVWRIELAKSGRSNLKSIVRRLPILALSQSARDFIDWVARWTLNPRGMVLRMMIASPFHVRPEIPRVGVRLIGPPPTRLTPARTRVLTAAQGGLAYPKKALAETAGCSISVIESLIDEGTLETIALPPEPVAKPCDPDFGRPRFEPDQCRAVEFLIAGVQNGVFSVTLLEGVTGSGKTEVYFEAVAAALRAGRQSLILLPEIALTAQFLDRFAARFGTPPGEWHSSLSERKRARLWQGVASDEVKVVAGARSALFLPFRELGLIIVDEEHDAAYKQEEGITYHARDMAVVRGRIEKAAVILSSATPSIESQVNAAQGRYSHVKLGSRFNARPLPHIEAIDLRKEAPPPGHWIAPRLAVAIRTALSVGEQALLFLNRRGYAPLTLCRACGHRLQCPQCTAWLVEHRFRRALICHHCGHV